MNGVFVRIVVPTDFSPCSSHAWQLAQRLAAALGSELILVHVFLVGKLWSESPFNMERVRELFADERGRVCSMLDAWLRKLARPDSRPALRRAMAFPITRS